ncbi:hypothetical protein B0H14DRAFT_2599964 [Mycena olivaceomarginata]|nr:hypothetical protein B0H14DRAFT_2599964 [Mycena olivaceomarginata]
MKTHRYEDTSRRSTLLKYCLSGVEYDIVFRDQILQTRVWVCVIIYVISTSVKNASLFGTIFQGMSWALVQLGVNIVPTFILVRVGMGRSTETSPSVTLDRNVKC